MPEFLAIIKYKEWDCEDPEEQVASRLFDVEDDMYDWVHDIYQIEREKEIIDVEYYQREGRTYTRLSY